MQCENDFNDYNYFKIYRDIYNHPIVKDPKIFALYIYLCGKANYDRETVPYSIPKEIRGAIRHRTVYLKWCQLVYSPRKVAKLFNINERTTLKWLDKLINYGLVKKTVITGWCSIVTVLPLEKIQIRKKGKRGRPLNDT